MPWLVLIPGKSYRYPWTLLTAGWVELSIFEVRMIRFGVCSGADEETVGVFIGDVTSGMSIS